MNNFLKRGTLSITVVLKKKLKTGTVAIDSSDAIGVQLSHVGGDKHGSYFLPYNIVSEDIISVSIDTVKYTAGEYQLRVNITGDNKSFVGYSPTFSFVESTSIANFDFSRRNVPNYTIIGEVINGDEAPTNFPYVEDMTRGGGGLIKAVYLYDTIVNLAANIDPISGEVIDSSISMPPENSHVNTANLWAILRLASRLSNLENGGGGGGTARWFYKFVDEEYPDGNKGNAVTGYSIAEDEDQDGNHIFTFKYDSKFLDVLTDAVQEIKGAVVFKDNVNIKKGLTVGEELDIPKDCKDPDAYRKDWARRVANSVALSLFGGVDLFGDIKQAGNYEHTGDLERTGTTTLHGDVVSDAISTQSTVVNGEVAAKVFYETVTVNVKTNKKGEVKNIALTGKKGKRNKNDGVVVKEANDDEALLKIEDINSALVGGYSWRVDGVEIFRITKDGPQTAAGIPQVINDLIPADDTGRIGKEDTPYDVAFINNLVADRIIKTYTPSQGGATLNIGIFAKNSDGEIDPATPDCQIEFAGNRSNLCGITFTVRNKTKPEESSVLRLDKAGLWFNEKLIAPAGSGVWDSVNEDEYIPTPGEVGKGDTIRKALFKLQTQLTSLITVYAGDIHINDNAKNEKEDGSISYPFHTFDAALAAIGTRQHITIHVWHLSDNEDVIINGTRYLTVHGECGENNGQPTMRSLNITGGNLSLIFDSFNVEKDVVINNPEGKVTFVDCVFTASTVDRFETFNTEVFFEGCYFEAGRILIRNGGVTFRNCYQHKEGVIIQTDEGNDVPGVSTVHISDSEDITYVHHAGKVFIADTNMIGNDYIIINYGKWRKNDEVREWGFVSDAPKASNNVVFLYGVSMIDPALNGTNYSIKLDACDYYFAAVARDRLYDEVNGTIVPVGLHDVDIISWDRPLHYDGGWTVGEKLKALDLAMSAGINMLPYSNMVNNPDRYDYNGATPSIDVNSNEVLVPATSGAGAKISLVIPKKYRSDIPDLAYTASLEIKCPFSNNVEILLTADTDNTHTEVVHDLVYDQWALVGIRFKWEEDADLTLTWQANEAGADIVVHDGVMLVIGDAVTMWEPTPFENPIRATFNRNYALGTFASGSNGVADLMLLQDAPLHEECVAIKLDKGIALYEEHYQDESNGIELRSPELIISTSAVIDYKAPVTEPDNAVLGYTVQIYDVNDVDTKYNLGTLIVPLERGVGEYHVNGSFHIGKYFPIGTPIKVLLTGVNRDGSTIIDATFSQVQIVKGNTIGGYVPAAEDGWSVKNRTSSVLFDDTKIVEAESTKVCQVNKNVFHLEAYCKVKDLQYGGAANRIITNIPLVTLDGEFINNRVLPISVIPNATYQDTVFTGYAKLINDSLFIYIWKSVDIAFADAVVFNVDFNIVKPTFQI